jgi:hypothetical protein
MVGTQHSARPTDGTQHLVVISARSTLDGVLDQLRNMPPGPVVVVLTPLSTLFSTPDHFRALDAVRVARSLAITLAVTDAHRTGLALAFGYRVRPHTVDDDRRGTMSHSAPPGAEYGTHPLSPAPSVVEDSPFTYPKTDDIRMHRVGSGWMWKAGLIASVALLLVAVIGMAVVGRVHTAAVVVVPAEQSFSRVVQFAVSVLPTDDPNTLQTTFFETPISRDVDAPATGKTTVPDGTAAGTMTFRSRADGATSIKAGTTLKGPHDVSYALQSDVVVPGLDFVRGQLGEASAKVRATQPGPAGNLGAGYSARYSDNVTFISGEITGGTEKQVPVVTDDDIAGARARLESDVRMRALTEVNAVLPAGVTALNDYLTLGTPTATAQPASGAQSDSVHVHVVVTARLPVYRNADFDALIDRRLTEAVREAGGGGDGKQQVLSPTVVKEKPVFVDVQGPHVRYYATVTGRTRSVIADADVQQLRHDLTGKDDATARRILAGAPYLQGSTITYGPAWLPGPLRARMPRDTAHLRIRIETSA